jgi:hypothetical protein
MSIGAAKVAPRQKNFRKRKRRRRRNGGFCSYLRGRQVAKARIVALDGCLLLDDNVATAARQGAARADGAARSSDGHRFPIAQVTRSQAILSLVETVGPVR